MKRKSRFRLALLMAMLWLPAAAGMAQQDVKGSADHPMLSRYPNSHITEYEKGYNAVEMLVGGSARRTAEKAADGRAAHANPLLPQ